MGRHGKSSAQSAAATQPLYFVNGWVDYLVIGGASVLVYLLLRTFHSGARSPWVWGLAAQLAWIVNWPHFSATNYRLYHSKQNIRQYPITALVVPFVVLAGVLLSFASPTGIAPFFVKFFLIWSPYHFSGQTVGVSLVYARRAGIFVGKLERFVLSSFVFSTFLTQNIRAEIDTRGYDFYTIHYPGLGIPAWTYTVMQAWMWLMGAAFIVVVARWCYQRKQVIPPIVVLPALTQFIWFIPGASWASFQEFVPFFHSLQYLLIAWSMQLKERMDLGGVTPSPRYVGFESLRWGALNFVGGSLLFYFFPLWASRLAGFELGTATAIVISGVQIHHFFVDGVIWKLKNRGVSSPLMVNLREMWRAPAAASPQVAVSA